jgi:hypothetical protein
VGAEHEVCVRPSGWTEHDAGARSPTSMSVRGEVLPRASVGFDFG